MVPSSDLEAEAWRLRHDNAQLEQLLELASGNDHYLILDVDDGRLELGRGGATLAEYELQEIAVGTPSLFFFRRSLPTGWRSRLWTGAELVPRRKRKRLVVEASQIDLDDPSYEPPIPLTPEEAVPAEGHFQLRFDQGLVLVCVADEAGEPSLKDGHSWLAAIARRTRDAIDAARPSARPRLRLQLRAEDAAAFYRAVPRRVRLIVL